MGRRSWRYRLLKEDERYILVKERYDRIAGRWVEEFIEGKRER